ncbi:MAG TPA: hypothetical protein VGM03_22575 [Phycisphaerae bacterium]|jgi:hypothetical protein
MFEGLKELLAREPFVPFRIVMTSGIGYDVTSPYQVALGETQLNYYYPRSDKWAVLRQNEIAAFEVGGETVSREANA